MGKLTTSTTKPTTSVTNLDSTMATSISTPSINPHGTHTTPAQVWVEQHHSRHQNETTTKTTQTTAKTTPPTTKTTPATTKTTPTTTATTPPTTKTTPATTKNTPTTTVPYLHDNIKLTLTNVQLDAFRASNTNATVFEAVESCANDQQSDILPIVIGGVLAGLIVFILIVYFIERRTRKSNSSEIEAQGPSSQ